MQGFDLDQAPRLRSSHLVEHISEALLNWLDSGAVLTIFRQNSAYNSQAVAHDPARIDFLIFER